MDVLGYGTFDATSRLGPIVFNQPEAREGEVEIEITHCGVCHSDLHQARNDWGNTVWPCIPGHEIVGIVRKTGPGVTAYKEGDRVGVGCMINSCQSCGPCEAHDEQYCEGPVSATLTYNGTKIPSGVNTYGGYTETIVVREEFVLRIPDAIDSAAAAPILCAGITVYAPMKEFGLKPGHTVAVAGVGGLGHMAVQIAKALGATVVAFSRSEKKRAEILEMGADKVVDPTDEDAMEAEAGSVDLMINTIPVPFDIAPYLSLMRHDGRLQIVGNMIELEAFSPGPMVFNRITIGGSLIGGIKDTQEVLDLCAEHGIAPAIQMIGIDDVNDALDSLEQGGIGHFRHVIDMRSLRDSRESMSQNASRAEEPVRFQPEAG
ncbi:alcohol dehydrogenase [Roseivivax halodurans JCM 10272]|uniref:Alcohol dehydrogenase n=1 Tax=Roseivivax halodurans JCM 10272 TaxID=1449350 RepID=X7EGP5_9RHOB|nr:NAD(P)-dependent alcohol dehydrogenase [Roseivivax halodurans]ETX15269.1 alcohol dehydrogenase [Roseivivax halodurans JCM 10272]